MFVTNWLSRGTNAGKITHRAIRSALDVNAVLVMKRLLIGVALAAGLLLVPGGVRGAVVIDSILVRIYDNAGVQSSDLNDALKQSREILRRAEVSVDWVQCPARPTGSPPAICDTSPAPGEMVVRLVEGAEKDRDRRPLGQPLLDRGAGVFATVFINRVNRFADVAQFSRSTILARAIAHEIGHLILGTNNHSESGLMREVWTVEQLLRNRPEDWQFSPAQTFELRSAWLNGGALASKTQPPPARRPRT